MKTILKWFGDVWAARCRKLDERILWPMCMQHARNQSQAKQVFTWHAKHDWAWQRLGEQMDAEIDKMAARAR